MKLWGVAMVRNEADIIEAFVRHNLAILDGLTVVDHRSSDRTAEVLAACCAERLPIVVLRSEAAGYLQAEITTQVARDACTRLGADWVFPLDADEFLSAGSRTALEEALVRIPEGACARLHWPTYVPRLGDTDPATMAARLRDARRLPALPTHGSRERSKVAIPRSALRQSDVRLSMGNHDVFVPSDSDMPRTLPGLMLDSGVAEICHVPIRSMAQFIAKITVRRLARVAANRDYPADMPVRKAFDAIRRGDPITHDLMFANHVPTDGERTFALGRPGEHRFLASIVLRHAAPPVDPLAQVAAAVEGWARALAQRRGKPAGG